jgi:hypothetical protein
VGALARTGGSARPALRKASVATAPIRANSNRLLKSCQAVIRSRRPCETNGRPHQSHSADPAAFRPPQPGQVTGSRGSPERATSVRLR